MQVVKIEFVTHYNSAQEAVDIVSQMLPNLKKFHPGTRIESWDIVSVDESVTHMVTHPVEDGKVIKNVK